MGMEHLENNNLVKFSTMIYEKLESNTNQRASYKEKNNSAIDSDPQLSNQQG